ncbi:unnamed protein product [Victoria cruziana]
MKRGKTDSQGAKRLRLSHILLALGVLYLVFVSLKFHRLLEVATSLNPEGLAGSYWWAAAGSEDDDPRRSFFYSIHEDSFHRKLEDSQSKNAPQRPQKQPLKVLGEGMQHTMTLQHRYGRISSEIMKGMNETSNLSELEKMADDAWAIGLKAWEETERFSLEGLNWTTDQENSRKPESCPSSISLDKDEWDRENNIMLLPCGLAAGSSITVVGRPHLAHEELVVLAGAANGISSVSVSQFMLELRGLRAVDGEEPPRILHLNPRLKGDWSKVPVIEHNTCYRMQWGTAQRCDGLQSKENDDTIDGFPKCEKWIRNDISSSDLKESKTTWWLKRFIGRAKKPAMTWPFPFVEDRLFVLTVRAGMEGYHINVGGRHVTSFPYRTGFVLEDATGLSIVGDVDVHSIYATSLPISHPGFSLQQVLEMSERWKAPEVQRTVHLFIGILSATNHFAERMAIRRTWMQYEGIKSSRVVARFFVALNGRKEVNALLKLEADYFGDVVILPFIDRYELVVLKTVAICEYGVHNLSSEYIMKCDDDTFVRVDTVLKEIKSISSKRPLYMGNLNLFHKPLRVGKWAVTFEEWPEEVYPPYANGPGYIISEDIARFIVSRHTNRNLWLFKMEDVSMGLWVQDFNSSSNVQYSHNWKFCQYGCMEDYYTAHYQSPRQMICLWDKLQKGRARCCNFR